MKYKKVLKEKKKKLFIKKYFNKYITYLIQLFLIK